MELKQADNGKSCTFRVDTPEELAYLNIESIGLVPRVGRIVLSNAVREIEEKAFLPTSVILTRFDATRIARFLTLPLRNKKAADRLASQLDETGVGVVTAAKVFLDNS